MVKHNLTRWTVFSVALLCDVRKEKEKKYTVHSAVKTYGHRVNTVKSRLMLKRQIPRNKEIKLADLTLR